MNLKKKIFITCYFFLFLLMSNCLQTSAFLGPVMTTAKTGNIYQGGLSYVSNTVIKNKLGESPQEFIKKILTQESNENGLIIAMKEKKIKVIKNFLDSEDSEDNFNEFISAVKKTLK